MGPIICHDGLKDSKFSQNISLKELENIGGRDLGQSFCFNPLGKVYDHNTQIIELARCWRKGTKDIHTTQREWSWSH